MNLEVVVQLNRDGAIPVSLYPDVLITNRTIAGVGNKRHQENAHQDHCDYNYLFPSHGCNPPCRFEFKPMLMGFHQPSLL